MHKLPYFSLILCVVCWLTGCGSSNKKVVVTPQTTNFAFMQAAPSVGTYMFSPALGTFSTINGNTTFSFKLYTDTSTNQAIAMDLGSIILSADGKRATFDLYGGTVDAPSNQWDIWVANTDGTGNPLQISNDIYEDYLPQFSPDGTKVVYASNRPIPGDTTGSYQWRIVVANSDGSGTAQVLPIPAGILYQMHPTYSPDGTKLAMMAGGYINDGSVAVDGIMLTNADGTNAQVLSNPLYSDACYYCADELPAFTPDGSQIVFSRDNWNQSTEFEDILVMNLDGTNQTMLTDNTGLSHDPLVLNVSGVGPRILFSSNRDNLTAGDNGFEIYSMKMDGTSITRLTSDSLFDAFSQWWYGGQESAAARHANLPTREHRLYRGHAAHPVRW
jgi:Tol biopolymer transport system component